MKKNNNVISENKLNPTKQKSLFPSMFFFLMSVSFENLSFE